MVKVHRIAHVIKDGYYGYIWIEQYTCRIIVDFCEGRYGIPMVEEGYIK